MDSHRLLDTLFGAPRALLGVIHLDALPGTPAASLNVGAIAEKAVAEAPIYAAAGFQGLMIENMHDRPYLKGAVGPEVVAAMAVAGLHLHPSRPVPFGVHVTTAAS